MRRKNSVKYVCPKCHTKERIPQEAIDLVNALDPERSLFGPPSFRCERCGYLYMMPEGYYEE